jgi:hypothetical protein
MSPAFVRKGMTKILQNSAFVSYASTFFASAATFNTVFCFFLANQTSFEDEFLPTAFFIDVIFLENNRVIWARKS